MNRAVLNLPGLIALGLAAALAGCGHSPPTRFFTLDALPPTGGSAVTPYAGLPVRLDSVHVPSALDRVEIVRQLAPNELDVSDQNHWGAPLGELARRALTQDLANRLAPGAVIFPDAPKPAPAQDLVIDILDIQTQGGGVTMLASYTLIPSVAAPGQAKPTSVQRQVTLTLPQASPAAADQADALSRLLAQLADRIAGDLAKPG